MGCARATPAGMQGGSLAAHLGQVSLQELSPQGPGNPSTLHFPIGASRVPRGEVERAAPALIGRLLKVRGLPLSRAEVGAVPVKAGPRDGVLVLPHLPKGEEVRAGPFPSLLPHEQ